MIREIKFRGISTHNNEWVKGSYLKTVFKDKADDHKIYPPLYNVNPHNIEIDTLGQYTGLKDKNGTTYCQDDIVKYKGKNYRLILGTYQFELIGFYDSGQDNPDDFFSEGAYLLAEIVGNIHENPELLHQPKVN